MPAFEDKVNGLKAGLRLRAQPDIEQRIHYVRGRAPQQGTGAGYEIAVSAETAEQLQRDLGAAMTLCVSCGAPEEPETAPVTIVGVFEPIDPSADEWADQALLSPTVVQVDQEHTEVHGTALIATGDVAPLWKTFSSSFRYAWRFILHWDDSSAAAADTIAAELGTLRVKYPFRGSTEGSDVPSVSTGLLTILERYVAERSTAQAAIDPRAHRARRGGRRCAGDDRRRPSPGGGSRRCAWFVPGVPPIGRSS